MRGIEGERDEGRKPKRKEGRGIYFKFSQAVKFYLNFKNVKLLE
jgi:hypothetical protein